ncbi:MAG: hypothetical protein ACRCX2_29320 [Paraclostridium sp.]
MGLLTNLGRMFRGKKSEAVKATYHNESYWNGLEADLDGQVKKVSDRYKKAKAVFNTKNDRLTNMIKFQDEMKATATESKELFKETNDTRHRDNAMKAFNKMNEYEVTISVLREEVTTLEKLVDELKVMENNAVHIANTKKAEIIKAKSRVQFSDTMKDLTDGIKEFTTMEMEGAEDVDIAYHENMANLEEINSGIITPVSRTTDFDSFMEA